MKTIYCLERWLPEIKDEVNINLFGTVDSLSVDHYKFITEYEDEDEFLEDFEKEHETIARMFIKNIEE